MSPREEPVPLVADSFVPDDGEERHASNSSSVMRSPVKPSPGHVTETAAREGHEAPSPLEGALIHPPLSLASGRPQSMCPGSRTPSALRSAANHGEGKISTPAGAQLDRAALCQAAAVTGAPESPAQPSTAHVTSFLSGPQPRGEPQPTSAISPPHAVDSHRSQISLVEEVLGPLLESTTAREVLLKAPNLSRSQLEDMRRIMLQSVEAQSNFDDFVVQVYRRQDDEPGGGGLAAALASATSSQRAQSTVSTGAPLNSSIVAISSPSHIPPAKSDDPPTRLGVCVPATKPERAEHVGRILGDLLSCPTVQQVLRRKPDIKREELQIILKILKDHPESRTDLQTLSDRLEAIDSQGERSPLEGRREKTPVGEARHVTALSSPGIPPGHENPCKALEDTHSRYSSALPQHQQRPPTPKQQAKAVPVAHHSSVRTSPPGEEVRIQEGPYFLSETGARQPPSAGSGALVAAAAGTQGDLRDPPVNSHPVQPHHNSSRISPNLTSARSHARGCFGRIVNSPSEGIAGPDTARPSPRPLPRPPHYPPHDLFMGAPVDSRRPVFDQQDISAVRPTPGLHESRQQPETHIENISMQCGVEARRHQQPTPSSSASVSPAPGLPENNNLEHVSIEINWARSLKFSDYLDMEACIHCTTVGEFFSLVEAQMPDEIRDLKSNGTRIKEIKVKSCCTLELDGQLPRIRRDEGSGRIALKSLIKKLRTQPPSRDIDLEFLVVWE